MPVTAPTSAGEPGADMFQRSKTPAALDPRSSNKPPPRPRSEATEIFDTDFDDESEFEEYSPKGSFESDDGRRRSLTTISSYDEVPTPDSSRHQRPFELRIRPVEGPKGPHLFRASQSSVDFPSDYALQMSPLLPKRMTLPTDAPALRPSSADVDVAPRCHATIDFSSIGVALGEPDSDRIDPEILIRSWTPQQVVEWMYSCRIDPSVIDCFELHDINGGVLLDLQPEDFKELGIHSFGKRHHLWNAIQGLRVGETPFSPMGPRPTPAPFHDVSRPGTSSGHPSPNRDGREDGDYVDYYVDDAATPVSPSRSARRRGRRPPTSVDITPGESVSIVAIEQLLPKPHNCTKGERCAKWRKQQRELRQLQDEHGIDGFPIGSPTKGDRIILISDTAGAEDMAPDAHLRPEPEQYRPMSENVPSVVASSDLLGPGQMPVFALHADVLQRVAHRDPQDSVRQFLTFQHLQSPNDVPPTPPGECAEPGSIPRSMSVPAPTQQMFPAHHHQAYPSLYTRRDTLSPLSGLKALPRLEIPRAASAGPAHHAPARVAVSPPTASSVRRTAVASPTAGDFYRLGTPASEMDVPVTAVPLGPVLRDTSQSVPPNMQYRQQAHLSRTSIHRNTAADWRRPSLPAVKEGEVSLATSEPHTTASAASAAAAPASRPKLSISHPFSPEAKSAPVRDPSHHSPTTQSFGYGADCSHAGWMRKRKTRMFRHEWQDAHFRLTGTRLDMHKSDRLTGAPPLDSIDVDRYAVACSSAPSSRKFAAAIKAFHIKSHPDSSSSSSSTKQADPTAFAFQLVPQAVEGAGSGRKFLHPSFSASSLSSSASSSAAAAAAAASSTSSSSSSSAAVTTGPVPTKTHHFAVKSKDERIDWMRELMLAKALQAKGKGYEVQVNGVQA